MNLREELIQVAAVAVAWIEDIDLGVADSLAPSVNGLGFHEVRIFEEVGDERRAQDVKWGEQHHEPTTWLAILAEEVGESAAEVEVDITDDSAYMMKSMLMAGEQDARRYLKRVGEDAPS